MNFKIHKIHNFVFAFLGSRIKFKTTVGSLLFVFIGFQLVFDSSLMIGFFDLTGFDHWLVLVLLCWFLWYLCFQEILVFGCFSFVQQWSGRQGSLWTWIHSALYHSNTIKWHCCLHLPKAPRMPRLNTSCAKTTGSQNHMGRVKTFQKTNLTAHYILWSTVFYWDGFPSRFLYLAISDDTEIFPHCCHQIVHRFSGFRFDPALHLKSSANWGWLARGRFTLQGLGKWPKKLWDMSQFQYKCFCLMRHLPTTEAPSRRSW